MPGASILQAESALVGQSSQLCLGQCFEAKKIRLDRYAAATQVGGRTPGTGWQDALDAAGGALPAALRSAQDAPPPAAPLLRALRDLGEHVCELERFAGGRLQAAAATAAASAAHSALEALRQQARGIDRALQPRLTPLLVWIALAAAQAQRRLQRAQGKSGALLDAFADNIIAWSAARRAARGRFRID